MAEPKKETVRIVLPARRDGTPVSSNPRETAMINLPPKPVPVQGGPVIPAGIKPPTSSLTPPPPSVPKPPSMPAIPKPPSSAGAMPPPPAAGPSIPKPPVMPPAATIPPMAPKPPTVPPAPVPPVAPKPPSSGTTPLKPVAPAPLQAEAKKETAKVPASTPGPKGAMPQATVQLQKKPDASKSVATTSIAVMTPAGDSASSDLSPVLGIAALVVALLSLGVQLLMMLG